MRVTKRSAAMPATVIDLLEGEWEVLRASPAAARALRRWGSEDEVLGRFGSVDELVAFAHERSRPAREREEVLASLACRSAADELAAQVLLHLLLPGCKALVASFACLCDSPGERAADVVGEVWARIRALPPSPRRQWVALPLLSAARRELRRRARDQVREQPSGAPGLSSLEQLLDRGPSAADELAGILRDATDDGVLSREQLELIWDYRLVEVPAVAAARGRGESPDALERRRLRYERKLRVAYAACA